MKSIYDRISKPEIVNDRFLFDCIRKYRPTHMVNKYILYYNITNHYRKFFKFKYIPNIELDVITGEEKDPIKINITEKQDDTFNKYRESSEIFYVHFYEIFEEKKLWRIIDYILKDFKEKI